MMVELWMWIVLAGMITLPGWALLTMMPTWRDWPVLQRWCLAVGLSVACYPVLFYGVRFLAPDAKLGPSVLGVGLIFCGVVALWRLRGHWREQFTFDGLELLAIGLIGLTLLTRFWIIRDHPYPAWSDSLHHVLLTQLTAQQGRLPFNLEPYFSVPMDLYHLGLYALSGSLQMLSQVPAHTALLWIAQTLNGLCGLGVYLALDRMGNRLGAVVGIVVVGLVSRFPAWYVNWGRFTQVSSQTILLIAWVVTADALSSWRQSWPQSRGEITAKFLFAGMLNSAVFLLHFRVAAYYLPLLALSVLWETWRACSNHRGLAVLGRISGVGVVSLIMVAPALLKALQAYISLKQKIVVGADGFEAGMQSYYAWQIEPYLFVMIVVAGVALMLAFFGRKSGALIVGLWMAGLFGLGSAYLLRIPLLNVTNMSAIEIMLYLPLGLVAGIVCQEGLALLRGQWQLWGRRALVVLLVVGAGICAWLRATGLESYRYFVTPADVTAMEWVKANTPADARFAINTYLWLSTLPQGTDAGYWLPYFAGRRTTAGSMLSGLGDPNEMQTIVAMSQAVQRLTTDNAALDELRRLGVSYVYIGKQGNFSGPGLNASRLASAPGVKLVYDQDGVEVLRMDLPER